MIARLLFAAFLLIVSGPALAADPRGTWALRAGDSTIMLFKVARTPSGWSGEWMEPAHYDSDGNSFSNVSGPVERKKATTARAVPGGGVELTFGHQPGTIPNVFVIRARGASTADLDFIAFGSEHATLTRATLGQRLGGWDRSRVYVRTIDRPTNAEMTAIFDADQADRQRGPNIDWKIVGPADQRRQARTQAMLDAGLLHSGEDYYHAAFVFQHGSEPGDYLKAHALAVIAAARGKPSAAWIAAATLDRYLQSIGQPQVYGTQFQTRDGTRRARHSPSVATCCRTPSAKLAGCRHSPNRTCNIGHSRKQRKRSLSPPAAGACPISLSY